MPAFRLSPDSSLARHTAKGIAWSALESFGSSGVSFIVSVIMAAFLAPREFGMVAMLQVFVALAQICVESGMTQALVRLPERSRVVDSTAFVLNLLIGGGSYLVLWLIAPWVARFYSQPELTGVMRVICLAVPVNALCVVQTARLIAAMNFRMLFKVSFLATLLSGVLGICLACCGVGVWALVWQQVCSWSLRALLLWCLTGERPGWRFSKRVVRSLFGFSWKVMASAILDTIWSNIYSVLIGKIFTPRLTGLFWRADSFSRLPATVASGVVTRVSYPVMGRLQGYPSRMNVLFMRVLGMSVWLISPCMLLMSALAEPLFRTFFNSQWLSAVPMFRVLCVAMLFYPVHALNLQILNAEGFSNLFLRLEIIKKLITVGILCVTVPLGVEAICWGVLADSLIGLPVNMWYTGRFARANMLSQVRLMLPVLILAGFATLVAYLVSICFQHPVLSLLSGIICGIGTYMLISSLLSLPWWHRIKHFRI